VVVAGSCMVVTRQITAVTERVARGSTKDCETAVETGVDERSVFDL